MEVFSQERPSPQSVSYVLANSFRGTDASISADPCDANKDHQTKSDDSFQTLQQLS